MPQWVVADPLRYGGTGSNTWDAEFASGTRVYKDSETNVHVGATASVPTDGTEVSQTWRLFNTNDVPDTYWELTFNPSYVLSGFDEPHLVTNETHVLFDVVASTRGVYVDNRTPGAGALAGGGGSPPVSTLLDDSVAYWKLNETAGSSSNDEVGTADLGEYGTAWGKNFAIVGSPNTTPGWTNSAAASVLTNGAAILNLGRSGASMSAAVIVAPAALGSTQGIMGEWEEFSGNNRSWRVRMNADGTVSFSVSSTGSAVAATVTSVTALAINTRALVVVALDQTANVIKISINGETYRTQAFASNLYDGAAPFAVGGTGESSAYISLRGAYDQPALWDNALTQAEVEELWNGGSILDLSTI